MVKFLEILMIFFTLSGLVSILRILFLGQDLLPDFFGGGTYQTVSYISAFSFGLNMYFIFSGHLNERFGFTRLPFYKTLSYMLLMVQAFMVIVSGGRGGLVLLLSYILLGIILVSKQRKKRKSLFIYVLITTFIVILTVYLIHLEQNILWIGRIKNLFSGDISLAMSYRDVHYIKVLELIKERPFLGYGVFSVFRLFEGGYPHNIVLEQILGIGVFATLALFLLFLFMLYKVKKITRIRKEYTILSILLAKSFVHLMFSGSYVIDCYFWFTISLVMGVLLKQRKKVSTC